MKTITTLKTPPKILILAGSMLIGLALMPATAIASNDRGDGYRSHSKQHTSKHQKSERPRHGNKYTNEHRRGYDRHAYDRHHAGHKSKKHRGHHYHPRHRNTRYVAHNYGHHHGYLDRLGFQIGLHTGNFDIVFRD